MTGDKSFFTSFKDFNGGNATFGDGSVACVRGGGSVSIPRCLNLNRVLFVDGLKANLISTSQIGDSELSVKFSQDMCEVFNRKGEITFTGHRIMNNFYAINSNSNNSSL